MSDEGRLDQPKAVREGEALDLAALAAWLRAHGSLLPEGVALEVQQFPSGYSNLTYMLRADQRELVMRRPPFGNTVASGHDMQREYRVLSALAPVYSLAPRPLAYCDDAAVIGVPFYLMERRRGTILRRTLPKGMTLAPEQARALSTSLIEGLADLHAIDWRAIGLAEFGKPEGYARRQVEGWTKRWEAAKTKDVPGMDALATWLAAELPSDADAQPALIHNDYKYDNVMLDPAAPTCITAVLDWEMATIGSPMLDLGTTLGYWVEPGDDARLQGAAFGPTHLAGSLSRAGLVECYEARSGRTIVKPVFARVFGMFKIAVILQQIYARYQRGSTKDPRFAALGYFVELLAEVGGEAAASGRL